MLRIGTRGSRLALAQAREVADLLERLGETTELIPIVTAGDRGASPRASPAGVKGLFVAEIVRALERGEVDLAVHSAKDLPADDPPGVAVAAVPRRLTPNDVLVTKERALGEEVVVATSSLRRRAQFLRARPRSRVIDMRGNVDTRLRKLDEGGVDALILAAAGLERLGLEPTNMQAIPIEDMVPAPGQGALAVQARAGEEDLVSQIDDEDSRRAFEAERALVARLGGGCRLPLGAIARPDDGGIALRALVISVDGQRLLEAEATAPAPDEAAARVADELLALGARSLLEEVSE